MTAPSLRKLSQRLGLRGKSRNSLSPGANCGIRRVTRLRRGCGHGLDHRWFAGDLEHDAGRPRRTTQRIRVGVALVLSCQPIAALEKHASQSAVGATVHWLWGERAGEHTAHEDEVLILTRP